MKYIWRSFSLAGGIIFGLTPAALADNVAHCEVLLVDIIEDEETKNQTQVASYRPAVNFIASVYDDEPDHLTEIDGHAIRALLCRRNNVIPSETDYPMIATGVPFIASQDFDSPDTDSLTIYWNEDAFDYVYKGQPLSDEAQALLDARLADFTTRGLTKIEIDEVAETSEDEVDESDLDTLEADSPDTELDEAVTETVDLDASEVESEIDTGAEVLDLNTAEIEIEADLVTPTTNSDIELDNIASDDAPADLPEEKSEE